MNELKSKMKPLLNKIKKTKKPIVMIIQYLVYNLQEIRIFGDNFVNNYKNVL